ncbi:MAG TPA: type II toxin-antitoxin system HicB family antitoxin [Tepidisphaeraceae bacterium]|nr:type II toxin-antitoxin system HicB family antitoxin [Tepidisphaeraceae bacterium]
MNYTVIIEPAADGTFSVYVPDLPGCVSTGRSREEAIESIRQAIRNHVQTLRELGEPVPPPRSQSHVVTDELEKPQELPGPPAVLQYETPPQLIGNYQRPGALAIGIVFGIWTGIAAFAALLLLGISWNVDGKGVARQFLAMSLLWSFIATFGSAFLCAISCAVRIRTTSVVLRPSRMVWAAAAYAGLGAALIHFAQMDAVWLVAFPLVTGWLFLRPA